MIRPGNYRLSRDVVNPRPDLRRKTDWRARPTWRAGLEFIVESTDVAFDVEDLDPHLQELIRATGPRTRVILAGHRWTHHAIAQHDAAQYAALEAALVPCAESSDALFTRLGCTDHFARWLVDSGRVDRALFEALHAEYEQAGGLAATDGAPARRLVPEGLVAGPAHDDFGDVCRLASEIGELAAEIRRLAAASVAGRVVDDDEAES